jgi:hypothetical protein
VSIHYKIAGVWTTVNRPYIQLNNIQVPIKEVWVKRSGIWEQSYEYDVTPPDIPLVSLELVETTYWDEGKKRTGRHIKVGVRSPLSNHDEDLKMIRVLTTYNDKAPTTQYGGTYTSKPDDNDPDEPWSDFSFNGHNGSKQGKDSSVWRYKTWPRNANNSSALEGQRDYHFTAWAQDLNGNWSAANPAVKHVPRANADGSDATVYEGRFQANGAGSIVSGNYTAGPLVQASSPKSYGIWFYGTQMNRIGAQGTAKVRTAQIYVSRVDSDGPTSSNIYLYWHEYGSNGALGTPVVRKGETKIGTLAKDESRWFDVPANMIEKMESRDLVGFGLYSQDINKASAFANDYSMVSSLTDNLRSGEVHVVWTEKP